MRANYDDIEPATPSIGSENVQCSVHQRRRLAKFCVATPVYNADRVIVSFTYKCIADSQCKQMEGHSLFVESVSSPSDPQKTSAAPSHTSTNTNTGEAANATFASTGDGANDAAPQRVRGPNRYYDLTNQRGAGALVKKVCWYCGIEDHEKPECPNVLCRTCHSTREHPHICKDPEISPFMALDPTLPLQPAMATVRCVSCFQLGHFDCNPAATVMSKSTSSCCYCGETGHNAYNCRRRKEMVPDKWASRSRGLKRLSEEDELSNARTYNKPPNHYNTHDDMKHHNKPRGSPHHRSHGRQHESRHQPREYGDARYRSNQQSDTRQYANNYSESRQNSNRQGDSWRSPPTTYDELGRQPYRHQGRERGLQRDRYPDRDRDRYHDRYHERDRDRDRERGRDHDYRSSDRRRGEKRMHEDRSTETWGAPPHQQRRVDRGDYINHNSNNNAYNMHGGDSRRGWSDTGRQGGLSQYYQSHSHHQLLQQHLQHQFQHQLHNQLQQQHRQHQHPPQLPPIQMPPQYPQPYPPPLQEQQQRRWRPGTRAESEDDDVNMF